MKNSCTKFKTEQMRPCWQIQQFSVSVQSVSFTPPFWLLDMTTVSETSMNRESIGALSAYKVDISRTYSVQEYITVHFCLFFSFWLIDWWLLLYRYSTLFWTDSLCLHVVLHEWLAFHSFFFFFMSTEVVYLQRWHGWCHMKLQLSWRKFCVHHTTMHHVTLCKATYVRCMRV